MDLKTYLKKLPIPDRVKLARDCGTTYGHLRNISYGKCCDQTLALTIEHRTSGAVTVSELRPDLAEALRIAGYLKKAA